MKKLAVILLLATVIGGVYYNALSNGFVFDDYLLVVNRSALPQVAADPLLALSPTVVGYRPLRTLSYVLDYRLGGLQPWIFHLNNLVYHWITAFLVFLIAFRLVATDAVVGSQSSAARLPDSSALHFSHSAFRAALFAAVLWAVHPIQTDAVTYISGRRDILTGLFFYLGLYAFLRLRTPGAGLRTRERVMWAGVAFLAYGLGLLSKEMAVTLPLVMLCYDYVYAVQLQEVRFGWKYVRELSRGTVKAVWEHKYLYLPLLLGGLCFSWYAAFVILPAWRIGWYGGSIGANFLTVARIWIYYLYLLLWPVRLLADYTGAFAVTHSLLDPWALLAVGFLFVLFLVTMGTLRYSRLATFSALWIAITLLPVSHLIPYPEMMAEHYLYIPSFGFCLLVALLLARLTDSPRSEVQGPKSFFSFLDLRPWTWDLRRWRVAAGYGSFVILLAFYAGRTVIRNRDWRDDLTFYNCLVRDNPFSARARLGLGYAYDRSGLTRMGIQQYLAGLRIDRRDPRLYTNLGAAHLKLKELGEAERVYQEALKLGFRSSEISNNLGFLYTQKGEFDKARAALEQAEKLARREDPAIQANWGFLYEVQNKLPEALEKYRMAKKIDPASEAFAQKIADLERRLAQPVTNGESSGEKSETP